jgi:hypothetical protein
MATNILKPIKGKVVRLTKLDSCGLPAYSAAGSLVTDGFVKVTVKPQYESGKEHIVTNAWGDRVISEVDPDWMKRAEIDIDWAGVNPDCLAIVSGAATLEDASSVKTGFTLSDKLNETSFAMEVWQKQAGGLCGPDGQKWLWWLFPWLVNGRVGDFDIQNDVLSMTSTVNTLGVASGWGWGPYSTVLLPRYLTTDEHVVANLVSAAPPAPTDGLVTLTAPVLTSAFTSAADSGNPKLYTFTAGTTGLPDVAYDWDFGDATVPHGTGHIVTHTYATTGSKTVVLTVTGASPLSTSHAITVT